MNTYREDLWPKITRISGEEQNGLHSWLGFTDLRM